MFRYLFSWSFLFLLVPILGVGLFVVAALPQSWPLLDHWFPEDISSHGYIIDRLFWFILILTGVVFIGTAGILAVYLWKFEATRNDKPLRFTHGNHTLEIVWSILPAATLLFIAIYQMDAWASAKMRRPMLPGPDGVVGTEDDEIKPAFASITGRQFEWRIAYAGDDQVLGTLDDLHTVNDLHLPINEEVTLLITSQDVLHSFFLPNVRIKQDVVPGMKQFVWFKPMKEGRYDIVCAELCGWGHYKMKGRMTVESRAEIDRYMQELLTEQNTSSLASN